MTNQERETLAIELEQEITEILKARQIAMDGFLCREVESVAIKLASKAIMKKHDRIVSTR